MTVPVYEEIHVVSDLHMGGEPGFQILKETDRLAKFIRWVGVQQPKKKVALILNGDVIDTLAEAKNTGYVAFDNAVEVVNRIIKEDKSFKKIWEAMAEFVKLDGRTLVFVLGNHDIELAFPNVQRFIVDTLAGDDYAARARIEFSTSGAGYACLVGDARVFCTHGNEVDAWNFIRYEDLGKAARRINAHRPLPAVEWTPNAGTKLVKDVMNEVKRKYAWIDLLKPEAGAAVGILAALEPSQLKKLKSVVPIVGKKTIESREVDQRLSAEGYSVPQEGTESSIPPDQILGPNLLRSMVPKDAARRRKAEDMLRDAETNYTDVTLEDKQPEETLGYGQLVWDRLTGWLTNVSEVEALRRALTDWLRDDKTFEIKLDGKDKEADKAYSEMMKSIGSKDGVAANVDFIVTGHTHLARVIHMGNNRYYFNCGTWIRLLHITDNMLKDENNFKPVYQVLKKGDMASIDGFESPAPDNERLILDRTSAVCIKIDDDGKVVGQLAHIKDKADGTIYPDPVFPPVATPAAIGA